MQASDHRFREFIRPDAHGPGHSVCVCGWESPPRWLETVAAVDHQVHQRGMAIKVPVW